jgi:hypothetical protein
MFIICLINHAANNEFYIGFIANLYMVCKDGEHPTTTLFLTKVSLHQTINIAAASNTNSHIKTLEMAS